jgi:hypothetical protein
MLALSSLLYMEVSKDVLIEAVHVIRERLRCYFKKIMSLYILDLILLWKLDTRN